LQDERLATTAMAVSAPRRDSSIVERSWLE
jgi:hypothetical protein